MEFEYGATLLLALLAAALLWRKRSRPEIPNAVGAEGRYRVLFEANTAPVLVIDRKGRYLDANDAALAFLETSREAIIGRHVCDLLPPEISCEQVMQTHGRLWREGGRIETAYWVNGRRKYLDLTIMPAGDGNEIVGIGRDVTEETIAAEQLARSRRFLDAVVNDLPELVCRWKPDGTITFVNDAYCDYFGKRREELIGGTVFATLPPDGRESLRQDVQRLSPEHPVNRQQRRMFDSEGQLRWFQCTDRGIFEDGRLVEVQSTGLDMTEEVNHTRELERVTRVLETLSRSNSALVHARDETQLMQDICRHIVNTGGYRMAWVGLPETENAGGLRVAAVCGEGTEFTRTLCGLERNVCPTCMAMDSGETLVLKNFSGRREEFPWIATAERYGFASLAVIPLIIGDQVFGALTILSSEPEAFSPEEVKLLLELAQDMAYGIGARRETERRLGLEKERADQAQQLQHSLVQTIQAMTLAVEKRDPYTAGHQQRVAQLATAIAEEMGLPEDQVEGIRLGAMVHDIGKIAIPSEILTRPGHLNDLEFSIIKPHPEVGHEILSGIPFPWPVADMILEHHERIDGSGYPKGLKNGAIRLEARILAVADTVEAASTHRPYRPGRPVDSILDEIEGQKGQAFDPAVVDACLRLFREKQFQWH